MTTDTELVERSRNRDADAFGALVTRHQQLVFGVALAHCHDPALAEDVAQEAFVAAWRDLDRLRDAGRVGPWVAGIARNLAATAARTRARRERARVEPAAGVPTPEDEALEREDRDLLRRALAEIPEAYGEVLVLFYFEGQSTAQIASALALGEDAVRQRLSRGRQALRDGVAARVETALARTRVRPAFRAGVVAALSTAGAREAAAGKVVLAMSAKKLVVIAAGVALAGGAVWVAARSRGAGETTSPAAQSAPAPTTSHVEKLRDKAARDRLLAAIHEARERREAPAAGGSSPASSSGTTARPALPGGPDLDKNYIRASVRALIPLLTECYEHGLERDPKLKGTVVVEFTIEGEPGVGGVIGSSQIDETKTDLPDPAVRECIQETMYALEIDPPAGGGSVIVVYPFTFARSEAEAPR